SLAVGEDELAALAPPAAEQRLDLRGRTAVGTPLGRLARQGVERGAGEVERELLGACVRRRRREHRRAGALATVDREAGEETGHRAAVAGEEAVAASVELDPEPPGERPALVVDHRLHARHL